MDTIRYSTDVLTYLLNSLMDHLYGYSCSHYIYLALVFIPIITLSRSLFSNKCRVNCWFCNTNSVVLIKEKNSFICSSCNQYNGFDKHGDYNVHILDQYDEKLNKCHPVKRNNVRSVSSKNNDNRTLCDVCIEGETRKMELLNRFNAEDDSRFEEKYRIYRERLERAFPLCDVCTCNVIDHLKNIKDMVSKEYGITSVGKENRSSLSIISHLNLFPCSIIILSLSVLTISHVGEYFSIDIPFFSTDRMFITFSANVVLLFTLKCKNLRPSLTLRTSTIFMYVLNMMTYYVIHYSILNLGRHFEHIFVILIPSFYFLSVLWFSRQIFNLINACHFGKGIGKMFNETQNSNDAECNVPMDWE